LKIGKERTAIATDEVAVKAHIKAILPKAIGSQGGRLYPMTNVDLVAEASCPVAKP